jgi:hypothetical protein
MKRTLARRLSIIVGVVAAVGAAACGPFRRGSGQPPAYLYFTNESLDQADVFAALPGGLPIRIGTVFAGRTDTLRVPPDIAANGQNINIVARLLARSARPSSGPVPIRPGDRLVVRLPSDQKLLVVLPAQ